MRKLLSGMVLVFLIFSTQGFAADGVEGSWAYSRTICLGSGKTLAVDSLLPIREKSLVLKNGNFSISVEAHLKPGAKSGACIVQGQGRYAVSGGTLVTKVSEIQKSKECPATDLSQAIGLSDVQFEVHGKELRLSRKHDDFGKQLCGPGSGGIARVYLRK